MFYKKCLVAVSVTLLFVLIFCLGDISFSQASESAHEPLFVEDFTSRKMTSNNITDNKGNNIWTTSNRDWDDFRYKGENRLTGNNTFLLGGTEKNHTLTLDLDKKLPDDFTAEFTLSVRSMANAGLTQKPYQERPILAVIPRSKNAEMTDYYALIYYLENSEVSGLIANLFKCRWDLVRVTGKGKMEILDHGYYMLDERALYDITLTIGNDSKDYVDIAVYIDGYKTPNEEYGPFLQYKDKSPGRISEGISCLSFSIGGFDPAGFEYTPIVELDSVKIYTNESYKFISEKRHSNYIIETYNKKSIDNYPLLKYLRNRGILDRKQKNLSFPKKSITKADFIVMLMKSRGYFYPYGNDHWAEHYLNKAAETGIISTEFLSGIDSSLNNHEMAQILYNLSSDKKIESTYEKLLKVNKQYKYERAIHYAFQNNLIKFDSNTISVTKLVTLEEASEVIIRLMDNQYSRFNFKLELPHVIGDGAILQREKNIPVWGRGYCGEEIVVKFKDQTKTTTVIDGYWSVELDPEPHGGPYTLSIKGMKDEIVLKDIYVGEVFLVSGQSNAEWFVKNSFEYEDTVANLLDKQTRSKLLLRYYNPRQTLALTPNFSAKGTWYTANETQIGYSSAIGTFFIEKLLELNTQLEGVPIGLVSMVYGGSTIELFMPDNTDHCKRSHNDPIVSGFWNGFMNGLSPMKFKGAIYYQGENSVQLKYEYERMLRSFITDIRERFEDKDLPFVLVQLTGYGESYLDGDTWPIIREIQNRTAYTLPNVGIVTAVDLSEDDPWEIHPRIKKPIGVRLAYKFMEMIYHKDLNFRSPEIKDYDIKDDKVTVYFDYISGSLVFKDNDTGDLEISGEDGIWHSAQGRILNNISIEVWSDKVRKPVGVRYAYRNYPKITLYDESLLPVLPFNTTVNRFGEIKGFTGENQVLLPFHGLSDWDAIVNLTRDNAFRSIIKEDIHILKHEYGITGQSSGDIIQILSRGSNRILEKGTTNNIIKMKAHDLREGDWIRNVDCSYRCSRVLEIIDDDSFLVNSIDGQRFGDTVEIYTLRYEQKAE